MDRNSVLAFLLIAIIILLMPEYYKLVYPDLDQTDSSRVETSGETTSKKSAKLAEKKNKKIRYLSGHNLRVKIVVKKNN